MTPTHDFPGAAALSVAALACAATMLLCAGSARANEAAAKPGDAARTSVKPAGKPAAKSAATAPDKGTARPSTRLAPEDLPPPAGEAAPAAVDPLEHLRQRLADRLSGGVPNSSGGSYDVRISTRSTLSPPAPAAATGAAGKRAARQPAKVGKLAYGPGAGAVHWGYQGDAGPAAWGGLKSEYTLCRTGVRQSPIDIRGGLAVNLDPVRFDYQASKFSVLDDGHTVKVKIDPGNNITIGARRFELQQFHFHRPSEERIDGRQFEMSLHLVHKDEQGRLAVVALLFDEGPPNPVVQNVWNNLPLERGEAMPAREPLELAALLPNDRRYYTYMGSLTTPPCSEGVQWVVMRAPQAMTAEQIGIFSRIYPMNARPLQAASGRRILQSD